MGRAMGEIENMRGSVEGSRRARARSRRHLLLSAGLGLIGVGALVACGEEERKPGEAFQLNPDRLRTDRGVESAAGN